MTLPCRNAHVYSDFRREMEKQIIIYHRYQLTVLVQIKIYEKHRVKLNFNKYCTAMTFVGPSFDGQLNYKCILCCLSYRLYVRYKYGINSV